MSAFNIDFLNVDTDLISSELDNKETCKDGILTNIANMVTMSGVEWKCGEIYISQIGNFTLVCGYCEEKYENIDQFGKHMHYKHFNDVLRDEKPDITEINNLETNHLEFEDGENSTSKTSCEDYDTETIEESTNNAEKKVLDNRKWFCEICSRYYVSRSTLTRHKRRLHNVPTPSERKLLANNEELQVKEERTGEEENLLCEICNREYPSLSKFKRHAVYHGITIPLLLQNDPSFLTCKYCFQEFSDRRKTLDHERNHGADRRYQCPNCPKSFRDNSQREMHLNTHTGERPFKCPHCSRAFSSKNYLAEHLRSHKGIKKFVCEVCGKGFLRNVDRNIHMRRHTGEKPYQCEECGVSFMVSGLLFQHRNRHLENNKPHKCDVCGNSFYSKKQLQDHKIMHSDVRPHECSECGRAFSRRKALLAHMKIHSDIKQYVCAICGKAFAQAAGLYSHKKSHGE